MTATRPMILMLADRVVRRGWGVRGGACGIAGGARLVTNPVRTGWLPSTPIPALLIAALVNLHRGPAPGMIRKEIHPFFVFYAGQLALFFHHASRRVGFRFVCSRAGNYVGAEGGVP
mmetsp:Transcript_15227/g.30106  ORF Transcript_15227/g.30106 Transcript_15227/m.30106 type:complete len:117 (-) Transcript_15227:113-463(-)